MMADIYSRNKLDNPDAETGDLTDWTYSNAAVAAGGPGDSTYCFRLAATGYLKQVISATTQPPDIKVGGFFLPELPTIGSVEKKYLSALRTIMVMDLKMSTWFLALRAGWSSNGDKLDRRYFRKPAHYMDGQ